MIDRDPIVSEDELHAYVDGELPAVRRGVVEAWLATHPEDAARVAAWRSQAELIRARYGGVADEAPPRRLDVVRLERRRRWRVGAMAAAAAIAAFTADALDAYRLYVVEVRHPVEVAGDERPHLTQWLSKRVGSPVRIPELETMGLKLVGGRLLPGPTGPTAFFMYEANSGERFTLYCGQTSERETALRYTSGERNAAYYWVDRHLACVLTGPAERAKLHAIAQSAYDQIDSRSTQLGG